jgi:hypothetical protein
VVVGVVAGWHYGFMIRESWNADDAD